MVAITTALALVISINTSEIILRDNDVPVFVYKYADVPNKPYLKEWYTPNGVNVLRDAPHDHSHHHGMMYALAFDGVNYWEEGNRGGYEVHQDISRVSVAPDAGALGVGFEEDLILHPPDSEEAVIKERRGIYHSPLSNDKVRVLTWESVMAPASEEKDTEVAVAGAIYYGLGMRFPEFMDKVGAFIMADDKTDEFKDGPHTMAQASWCAYTVEHDDTPITIAMFNDPNNPRSAVWFTMLQPFSYLAATLDLSRNPMTLKGGEKLAVCYGVAAWDAVVGKSEIELMYTAWLNSIKK